MTTARGHCLAPERIDAQGESGWPFFGQYVAHDLTADRSPLRGHADFQWLVGPELVEELLAGGPRFYLPAGEPFVPVEFADAAYRYGHSQIRQLYQLQREGPLRLVFPDLIGFGPLGDRRVDWSLLFDVPGRAPAQRSKPIEGTLPRSLIELPAAITGVVDEDAYRSLATRDLERGPGTGLPSGESVARLLETDVLDEDEIGLREHGWRRETPLWLDADAAPTRGALPAPPSSDRLLTLPDGRRAASDLACGDTH